MPKPSHRGYPFTSPTQKLFTSAVNEFWFEAYEIAKSLKREELWAAKIRSHTQHELLLRMIEWEIGQSIPPAGKRLKSYIDPSLWDSLHKIFSHFDSADSWKAYYATTSLFQKLSVEVASKYHLVHNSGLQHKILTFLNLTI